MSKVSITFTGWTVDKKMHTYTMQCSMDFLPRDGELIKVTAKKELNVGTITHSINGEVSIFLTSLNHMTEDTMRDLRLAGWTEPFPR